MQDILRKSTDFLRRIIVPVEGLGGVTLSYVCSHCLRVPLENWHDICRAIFQGVEGSEWETVYYNCKELHKVGRCEKSGENKRTKALWSLKEAKDNGTDRPMDRCEAKRKEWARHWQCDEKRAEHGG